MLDILKTQQSHADCKAGRPETKTGLKELTYPKRETYQGNLTRINYSAIGMDPETILKDGAGLKVHTSWGNLTHADYSRSAINPGNCLKNRKISTLMTQIKPIFTDRKNLCSSVTSVLSVYLKKAQQFERQSPQRS